MNALGIGANGETAYAISRSGNIGQNVGQVYSYNSTTGVWAGIPNSGFSTGYGNSIVAGAVDLKTGLYVYGLFTRSGTGNYLLHLFVFNPSTNAHTDIGTVNFTLTGSWDSSAAGMNGDFAFDSAGNLNILASSARYRASNQAPYYTDVQRAVVSSANFQAAVAAASSLRVISRTIGNKNAIQSTSAFNGVAFDSDGSMLAGTDAQVITINPDTLVSGSVKSAWTDGSGTDLASCSSPPSLAVQKNVQTGRVSASDQFILSVRSGSTTLDTATTSGAATGIQTDYADAENLTPGASYTIMEAMAAGSASALSAYTSTWSCTNAGTVMSTGNGTSASVTLPALVRGQPGANIVCTFTNTPPNGTLRWAKGNASNTLLPGSEWSLVGPGAAGTTGSTSRTVTDCVGATAAACTSYDQNFQSGIFEVNNLPWGSYTLTETKAPTGYALDPTVRSFTIGTGSIVNDLGTIINTPLAPATVTIKKTVQDVSGQNPVPGQGWTVGAVLGAGSTSGVTISTPATKVTGSTGSVATPWSLTFPTSTATANLTVSETQQTGYAFVSGTCTVTPASGATKTVTLTSTTGVVPDVGPGASVDCTFVNRQIAGSAAWHKVDSASTSTLLSGSTWTLWPLTSGSCSATVGPNSITVVDNGSNDADASAGVLKVAGLEWGQYCLKETAAPVGFLVSSVVKTFTIGASNLNQDFTSDTSAPFANERQTVPGLPLTGGQAADTYLMLGAGLLVVALGLLGAYQIVLRRKRREL